jgi:hypothetical protein
MTAYRAIAVRRLAPAAILLAALVNVAGCERPCDRTPAGFCEACYGGRGEAMKRNWLASKGKVGITIHGSERDWPALKRILGDVARSQGLALFDNSATVEGYVRTFGVSICDARGLNVYVDKRIYDDAAQNADGDTMTLQVLTYSETFDWRPVSDALVDALNNQWRGKLEVRR